MLAEIFPVRMSMKQRSSNRLPAIIEFDAARHGGDLRRLAERAGCAPDAVLDFSASLNPVGPPPWLGRELTRATAAVCAYPDPESTELLLAAGAHYQVSPGQVVAGNGASELIYAAARLHQAGRAVIPVPAYGDYARACCLAGLEVEYLPLDESRNWALDLDRLRECLREPALVFLGHPNNPTGSTLPVSELRRLIQERPDSLFVVDESFADFTPGLPRFVRDRPANVVVLVSMTKFYAIAGLRLGLAFGTPELVMALRRQLPDWTVNSLAQRVGWRCLQDLPYGEYTRSEVGRLRGELAAGLGRLPGLKTYPSAANFLLYRLERRGGLVGSLAERLLRERIAIRPCENFQGLDERYFRVAVRSQTENDQLLRAMERVLGMARPILRKPPRQRKPAIMLQGTCSNAGKSVLAAALCRIFLQDGLRVAPFKAQNMSNNSFVTRGGGEMGRAQVTQALACRLDPDVRMNPVLLKPGSDTGSQVVVLGRAVGNMEASEYVRYKPSVFGTVKRAYDELSEGVDVMVLEGAGSPVEINLKHHDIVNMAMAEYADARVLLVGDIDRGGVYAALAGTLEFLTEAERARVLGLVLNRFRGDARLLESGNSAMYGHTGKPVLGVVPNIEHLGLPEEDSVSFKAGVYPAGCASSRAGTVDIACIDLGHISNFNDLDPFFEEPDVRLRVVASALELGEPDAVILPGTKNTVADMRQLRDQGMVAAVLALVGRVEIVGICGGFQMLGREIDDPHGLETDQGRAEAFALLDLRTTLARDKTLTQIRGEHHESGQQVFGYEIHHGVTETLSVAAVPIIQGPHGPLGFSDPSGRVWGTYLHGVFDHDGFRRWFINRLRVRRGLAPLDRPQVAYSLEPALDKLASVVRRSLDMDVIYRALGLAGKVRPRLIS